MGDPTRGSPEKGRELFAQAVESLAKLIREIAAAP